jgi:Spy/CpxP family protein refolding chaperone
MSLKNKLVASAFAVSAFAVAGFAQEAKPEAKELAKDGGAKIERKAGKLGGRGMRGGLFGRHMGGGIGRHLLGIELTEQQKAQVKDILQAAKPDAAIVQEARTIMRAKFEGTATAEQEARLQVLKTQAITNARNVKTQLEGVLTAEQKAQIEQKKQEMKAKRVEMRERFKDRHNEFFKDKATTKPGEVKKDN